MINKVQLIGNVGKDPKKTGNILTFSLATSESFKDKAGEWKNATEWHNIKCFGFNAEKQIITGQQVYIDGKIKTESWEKDNIKHTKVFIYADTVKVLGQKSSETKEDIQEVQVEVIEQNDLPF